MPKRILDGEAMWASTKLSQCPEWAITYYPWLYPLADANGSFEMSNLRVLWAKVSAILPNFRVETLIEILNLFEQNGLLFVWDHNGKKYGHWTGCEREGLLPPVSRRGGKYGRLLAPAVPADKLRKYQESFLGKVSEQNCSESEAKPANGIGLGIGIGLGVNPENPAAKCAAVPSKRSKTREEQKRNIEARNERVTQEIEVLKESIAGAGPGTEQRVERTVNRIAAKMAVFRPRSEAEYRVIAEDQKRRLEQLHPGILQAKAVNSS